MTLRPHTFIVDDERHSLRRNMELAHPQGITLQSLDLQLQDVVVQLALFHLQCVRVLFPRAVAATCLFGIGCIVVLLLKGKLSAGWRGRQHFDVHRLPVENEWEN